MLDTLVEPFSATVFAPAPYNRLENLLVDYQHERQQEVA